MLDWYLNPPFSPIIKVHVFNYTNIEEFVSGIDKKLKVKEVGPYVYEEALQKTNVQYNEDRITYFVSINIWSHPLMTSIKNNIEILAKDQTHNNCRIITIFISVPEP